MATVVLDRLLGCDGFRVESPEGLLGWVEEAWLGPSREPTALAIRTIDGRRGLLVAGEIETVVLERELVVPHVEIASVDGAADVSASWQTTGEVLEPPLPPGPVRRALLALRPWRLAPPPKPADGAAVARLRACRFNQLREE